MSDKPISLCLLRLLIAESLPPKIISSWYGSALERGALNRQANADFRCSAGTHYILQLSGS